MARLVSYAEAKSMLLQSVPYSDVLMVFLLVFGVCLGLLGEKVFCFVARENKGGETETKISKDKGNGKGE